MGVPKFFRWAAERYPSIITPFKDSPPPVDNLYLDINGIIHNCTHPNDIDATRRSPTEKEMIQAMFTYLEKLFNAIQPRKYFLLAVDGVAPRAKMNQQRQRRYRAGYEMMIAREEALAMGEEVPEEKDVFDSNCITPGTPFMVRVSTEFQYFITMKLATDPAWQNCQVIFSGHDCPGEGEHKIVDFVRRRKMQPGYDPNETHCMYGLDADLVMLSLATHEPHFVLLREVVTFGPGSRKERERQEEDEAKGIVKDKAFHKADEFVLLHIGLFRDYLQLEVRECMTRAGAVADFDFERVIDDFVFMCFFIGNDFLPTLPTVGINDGSMPVMLHLYCAHVLSKNKYLTNNGIIDWRNAELWMNEVGKLEFETLRRRQQEEAEFQKHRARRDPTHEVDTTNAMPITSILEFKQRYYGEKHGFAGGWDANSDDMRKLREHYVEGLMWVMAYYYQGVPSWKWFFPHYYAPMASDMINLPAIAAGVHFDLGKPFFPHQQLLAVLPPMSYLSMPKAYWPLLRSPNSPLAKYLPDHIVIDREGARAPWEGIVLIPFIDERVLVAAYDSVQKNVEPDDAANNVNGPPLRFRFDSNMMPYELDDSMFGPLRNVLVQREVYSFPSIDRFIPQLCPGAFVGTRQLEGFSTMQSKLNLIRPSFEAGVVTIFGRPTKSDSLLLNTRDAFSAKSIDPVATLVGKEVLVGFPHYKRARVASVKDVHRSMTASYSKEGTYSGAKEHKNNRDESVAFLKEADTHARFMKSQLGIAVEQVDVLVYVHRFNGMQMTRRGHIERHFASTWTCYPIHLIATKDSIDMKVDSRYEERDRSEDDCAFGARCAYIGPQPKSKRSPVEVYGSCGTVVTAGQHDTTTLQGDHLTVRLKVFQEPLRLPADLTHFAAQRNWTALPQVAVSMDIMPRTLTMICSSLVTSPAFGSREIGLCLKFTGRCLAKVGYAKLVQHSLNPWYMGNRDIFARMEKDTEDIGYHLEKAEKGDFVGNASNNRGGSGTWYFSRDAQDVLREYVTRFRPLIQCIEDGGVNSNSVEPPMFLTGKWRDRDADEVLTEIEGFLLGTGLRETPMITATEEAFPKQLLEQLEASLSEQRDRPFKELTLRQVSRHQLYFPVTRSSGGHLVPLPLPQEQTFRLGSRVVNCRATGSTPFGAPGTIVRLLASGREAEVVYDQPFTGGTRLDGRLQDTRAAITKLSALLVLKPTDAEAEEAATAPTTAVNATEGAAQLRELNLLLHANGIHVDAAAGRAAMTPPSLPPSRSPHTVASHSSGNNTLVPKPRSAATTTEPSPSAAFAGKRSTPASATAHLSSTPSSAAPSAAAAAADVDASMTDTHVSVGHVKLTASPGSGGISVQDLARQLPQRMSPIASAPVNHPPTSTSTTTTTTTTTAGAGAVPASGITIPAPKSVQQQHTVHPVSAAGTAVPASSSSPNPPPQTTPSPAPAKEVNEDAAAVRKARDIHVIPDDFVSGRLRLTYKNTGSVFRNWLDTFTADAVAKTVRKMEEEEAKAPRNVAV
ncbi:putative 5'-3' exonuclease [Leptomonas pyrrhocoris]|uniref:5'-3' exoribonuclease 2 n=1 Tax=Leptomonas pyrrhocoris TaxID=157538 RepID=A0A0M9G6L5_LEPPY|nr:putative 5'-3' exonuclease [Leptomonas pyrrhocoris]XP_015662049.1 putative 5'-3' exonuclease [Leptomonas pyrrhocoris]XP_015662050.1 putative 5'-3' exonuclease [Leptomonas pyrrhocoris]KPA83609.1 putative 5'-3' exonuclease [Leptomonas pyrrhocoris]KPA83610.1 putative 5'-3' exonuclease [Leptomonas pyrrhocoris]KPA83611.1 putative 5'-3' exonuclease [Leptomonas pyrrhocoris]|eukprot:XP_015662048.1 putative 5'-3' exonuclease [Leptomonas pyrrhocoris]